MSDNAFLDLHPHHERAVAVHLPDGPGRPGGGLLGEHHQLLRSVDAANDGGHRSAARFEHRILLSHASAHHPRRARKLPDMWHAAF